MIYRGVLAGPSKLRARVVPREEGIPRPKNASWCAMSIGLPARAPPQAELDFGA